MASCIQSGNTVLFQSPNGDVRAIKVEENSCADIRLIAPSLLINKSRVVTVGKVGSFFANELINEQYGYTYEIIDKKLKVVPPKTLEDIGMEYQKEILKPNILLQRTQMQRTNS